MKRKTTIENDRKTVYLYCRDKIDLPARRLERALNVPHGTAQGWNDFCSEEELREVGHALGEGIPKHDRERYGRQPEADRPQLPAHDKERD